MGNVRENNSFCRIVSITLGNLASSSKKIAMEIFEHPVFNFIIEELQSQELVPIVLCRVIEKKPFTAWTTSSIG